MPPLAPPSAPAMVLPSAPVEIAIATILSHSDLWRTRHAPLKIESEN
jgi:hypothetical protein